ncbi:MAG: type III-B CRISPR-associated protein Cas10/Cmr2 [Thermodesulfovibrionales bacterium]|nr:type III-B CRISPR-associated protein Cas10/Cmr2 [Thermodesulfovibrionales bacterium]
MIERKNILSYAGFTIGPIVEVLSSAKKTRELWFGSYFFSWYMECLCLELGKNKKIQFIIPYFEKVNADTSKENTEINRIGFFPDRFILSSELEYEEVYESIKKANEENLDYFAGLIKSLATMKGCNNIDSKSIKDILSDYLRTNFLAIPASAIKITESNESLLDASTFAVGEIKALLDSMEENRSFSLGKLTPTCQQCRRLPGIFEKVPYPDATKQNLCPLCLLKLFSQDSLEVRNKLGIPNSGKQGKYPSTAEISAKDIFDRLENNPYFKAYIEKTDEIDFNDKEFLEILKKNELQIKPYHRYMAIVQADGDDLGKAVAEYGTFELSKKLSDFSREIAGKVSEYHGKLVYCGGDDLLAFFPLAYSEKANIQTVIDFAIELSNLYQDKLSDKNITNLPKDKLSDKKFTISVGINIFYFKSPLASALDEARQQLKTAKKMEDKNALALQLTQHAGQQTPLNFKFDSNELSSFNQLLQEALTKGAEFPYGLHHNLSRFVDLLSHIPDPKRLEAFFKNNFDSQFELNDKKNGIVKVFKLMVETLSNEHGNFDEGVKSRRDKIESFLRYLKFIKFIRGEKE